MSDPRPGLWSFHWSWNRLSMPQSSIKGQDVTRVWGIMCIHYFCCRCVIYRYEDKLLGICLYAFSSYAFSLGVICFGEMRDLWQSLFSKLIKTTWRECHTSSQILQHHWSKYLACLHVAPSDSFRSSYWHLLQPTLSRAVMSRVDIFWELSSLTDLIHMHIRTL